MSKRTDIALAGCNPTPLAGYLRALAVLRLVSEQVDAQAQGWWENDVFHLNSTLDEAELVRYFTENYVPTPILAPWNGGSGFYPKRASAYQVVATLREAQCERLSIYRSAIAGAQRLVVDMGLDESPEKQAKTDLLALYRSWLPDEAVEWLDAAVVLTSGSPRFPPLLGTGGNDGNLEFTNNFMQRILDLFDAHSGLPQRHCASWLKSTLFGLSASDLPAAPIGQFSPGSAGGPNARAGYKGIALSNPWEFVLMLEGALVFAAAATKRLETGRTAVLSYPFTVYSAGVGSGSVNDVDESSSRPEMWMPLWGRPASFREIAYIFQEGRIDVKGRPARDGVDFARACSALAVDRGIDSFQRYAFVQRSGNMYLAAPLNRFVVARRPEADVLSDLDKFRWLDNLSLFARKSGTRAFQSVYRQIREAMFQLCAHGGWQRVQALLIALGNAERLFANSPTSREEMYGPLVLTSTEWLKYADDGSAEFELAASIAAWYAHDMPHIRSYFSPVAARNAKVWSEIVEPRVIWQGRDTGRNLVQLLGRRLIDANMKSGEPTNHPAGAVEPSTLQIDSQNTEVELNTLVVNRDKPFGGRVTASLSNVMKFIQGDVDDGRISDLIWGLLPLSASDAMKKWASTRIQRHEQQEDVLQVPWTYAVTRLVSTSDDILKRAFNLPDSFRAPMPREFLSMLASGSRGGIEKATEIAARRLRVSGFGMAKEYRNVTSQGLSGRRCAAALAFPLSYSDLKYLQRLVHAIPAQSENLDKNRRDEDENV